MSDQQSSTGHWSRGIRRLHRLVSVLFTASVVATTIVLAQAEPVIWMSYLPLLPLFLLFASGTYLYILPHLTRWRRGKEMRHG